MRAVDHARKLFRLIDMDNPPVNLEGILENLGVKLHYEDFSKIDGIAIKSPRLSVIVVNRNLPVVRQRFTIAHELGHIVMPHKGQYYICYPGRNRAMERTANRFAAELLMPQPIVLMLWKKYSTNRQFRPEVVAHMLKVSKSALFARLREIGITYK